MAKESTLSLERLSPILIIISIVLAFMVGILWQKVDSLEKGGSAGTVANQQVGAGAAQPVAPQGPTQGKLSEDQAAKLPEVGSSDHIRGNANADVIVIEYSDFECPFCSRFHPTMQQVMDEYGDQVAWVYRHFPLDSIHPKARPAAIASECVANLGGNDAFWAYADALFTDPTTLLDLSGTATKIGVNGATVQSCIDNQETLSKVDEQYQGGLAAGVTGTPGNFIINSKGEVWLIPGALPYEQIKTTIDEALSS
jgi:protein-disulfide isomerase